MEKRPDAKYIFMIRDFDSWFQSMIGLRESLAPLHRYRLRLIPWANALYQFSTHLAACNFGHPGNDSFGHELVMRATGKSSRSYHKKGHAGFVKAALDVTAAKDNALLFNIKTGGYKQLCEFL
jgi:hypothetical protein